MSEAVKDEVKTSEESKQKDEIVSIGLDLGTMHIVCARSDQSDVKITRNVFLSL